ncbi:signal recognition particle subunit SRP72 [Agrilus planipennis]|uniref:Signal recognition particle subunit SRP72 n=1 Tax=Agrilus planipennis TaxID=224129 RepID=A0A1W4X8G0_AGRPL|nr:signal recognition particle subunit SRP72 [Agrilus planipennis]
MADKAAREKLLTSNYYDIFRYSQDGEWDRAFKASNRVIHMAPLEYKALHCKIVCLIQQSKFDEALAVINKNQSNLGELTFEKAYCQYRLNQPELAFKILENDDKSNKTQELKVQVLYRLERYQDAFNLYKKLINAVNDEYEDERKTNLTAALSLFENKNQIIEELQNIPEDTYEQCYNKSCCLIALEQFSEVEKKLKQCEKMCRDSLDEEGCSEEEINVELSLIRIQLAYVYQKLGRIKEAQQIYTSCLKLKLDDPALIAVAGNNSVVINKDQNIFDSKKKMKSATSESLIHKLPSRQRKFIALNNAIFLYYTNQFDQCTKACKFVEQNWPELSCQAHIVSALCTAKKENVFNAVNSLKNVKTRNSSEDLLIKLTCTQLLLAQGEKQEACKILESLGDNSYKPGIVGALITLHLGMGNEETASKFFEMTVDWYKKNKVKGDLSSMWRQAAEFHIQNGHPQVAASSLEELLKFNPQDKKTIAQLVLVYALFDKNKVKSLSEKLPSIGQFAKDIDLESLESSSWLTIKKVSTKIEMSPNTPKGDATQKKKTKKRKGKLPKYYDPNIPPDPERWLPKYERSGYRKKRDRRLKEVIKGSQGTASGQSDQYDFSKTEAGSHESPVSSVEPSPAARANMRKTHQKKKNKRR